MKKTHALFKNSNRELFLILIVILGFAIFIPIFTYIFFAQDLKDKNSIMNKNDTGVILFDSQNHPFFTLYQAKYIKFIPFSQIPKTMQFAVIASEDKDFYNHSGFSLKSILRAISMNLTTKDQLYGGSTITQQLVKNALLNSNKNITRKLQEVVLALEIERKYSKSEILEMYLNSVYFGEGSFGVENAAKFYFNKNTTALNLNEEAFLAAILPSPSSLSPFRGNVVNVKKLKNIVLKKMYEQKYITKLQMHRAINEPLVFHTGNKDINVIAPHFALMIRDELVKNYGEEFISRSGFRVKTTLNPDWQEITEKAVSDQVTNLQRNNVSNGAAVVLDPRTGEIKALVGSTNWYDDKFGKMNLATAPRSMGSSFKPIVYSAALELGLITPETILRDVPTTFEGGYKPNNYDRKFRGNVSVRRALANSLNVPSVEVMQRVGIHNALEMVKRLGITSLKTPSDYGLSLVLGAGEVSLLEMTGVYAVLANQGVKNTPITILEIYNKQEKKIYTYVPARKKVLNPEVTTIITSILSDNKARAEVFGNLLTVSQSAAVKTGTAEDWRDSITIGYTPTLSIGVWIGNNDNTPMDGIAGSLGAAPIWKTLIQKLSSS